MCSVLKVGGYDILVKHLGGYIMVADVTYNPWGSITAVDNVTRGQKDS